MTTVIPFIPSNITTPTIPMTLDGAGYNITVTWNISGQRYYINVYDTSNNWIITVPLISTPPGRRVQSAAYDPFLSIIVVQLVDPSLWPIPLAPEGIGTKPGTMVDYTLEGFSPDTYNGTFRTMALDPVTFTFPMAADPGPAIILGSVHRLMNMVESVFQTSSLVYRNSAFEVNP